MAWATVTIRTNEAERGVLEVAARAAGCSVGVFVKRAALAGAGAVAAAVEVAVCPVGSAGSGVASDPPTGAQGVEPGRFPAGGPAPSVTLLEVVLGRPPFAGAFAKRAEALRAIRAGRVRVAGRVVRSELVLVDPDEVTV